MDIAKITVGKRVGWATRAKTGKGKVTKIDTEGKRGTFIHIETKDHPTGSVCVRASQVSSAK